MILFTAVRSLEIVIDGTDNPNIDGVIQIISLAFLEGSNQVIADVVSANEMDFLRLKLILKIGLYLEGL